MDLALAIAGALLVLIGFAGSVLPVLPGPPISWAGYLLLIWTHYVEDRREGYETTLWVLLFVVIVVTVLDYVVPIWGTKKFGGSKRGIWGATIGLVIGLFLGPVGIIAGPFIGAYLGEMSTGKREKEALRAAWGSFVGFLTGIGLKLMTCGFILFFFVRHLFF
ncbi:MAG TPA: DUF456 domain-containing protein [Bacteroidaceae bacterium]|nr:DUF456 domain-containing protein [Bacteroidaceae bacterium]